MEKNSGWNQSLGEEDRVSEVACKYFPGDSEKSKIRQLSSPNLLVFMVFVFISRRGKYQAICHQFFGILSRPPVSGVLLWQCSRSFSIVCGIQFPLKNVALSLMRMFSCAGSPWVYILVIHWAIIYILVGKKVDQVFQKPMIIKSNKVTKSVFYVVFHLSL